MTIHTDDLKEVQEYADRLRTKLTQALAGVYLFGSRARGDARGDSDYDVAVFVEDGELVQARRIASDEAYPYVVSGTYIRPLVMPASRFEEHSDRLRHIRSVGISLI